VRQLRRGCCRASLGQSPLWPNRPGRYHIQCHSMQSVDPSLA
jgi:hypothetical protein